ncbi:vitelline membrane outer layer protein 1 homolog isoform X1 [Ambystoma mexicanum]|uniref:vitelline membrane outer layer protein 1 homolog isoform X1 n=1 Tax=Ambystoma mexicanum TaxID=8296 RepID=UPI0037E7A00E
MMQVLGFAALVFMCGWADGRKYTDILYVTNGQTWGDWHAIEMCPTGTFGRGFSIKMEEYQGKVDDTSVNGIRLYCTGTKYDKVHTVESGAGGWGHWMPTIWCPGVMLSFSLKVDPKHGKHGDDTAVNNIKFYCSSGIIIEGNGGKMGTYGPWSASCAKGICGIQTRVEGPQWLGDDTALNDAQLLCCNV